MIERLQIRATFSVAFLAALGSALVLTACSKEPTELAGQSAEARASQIAALEARADRIKDANDIKRLQRAYGYYIDKGEWDQAADLFAADATAAYANQEPFVGQDRIREHLKRQAGGNNGLADGKINNHMQLQPVVHVAPDGNTAKARWRALIQTGEYKKSAHWGEATYENEYVKENGVWKIKSLHEYLSFMAPYERGWAKVKIDTSIAPYHYENPAKSSKPPMTAISHADLNAWDLEVARLEAHDEVENLQAAYGYYFDKNQWDQVAELFTENATYEIGQRGVYKGRKRIRQALDLIGPAGPQPGVLNNELQLQPIIHVSKDGQTAKARWRTLEMKSDGKSGAWGEGIYENEYALENGVWKISKLHYYLTFRADYDKGWAKGTLPIEQQSETLPPDAPPTEVYGALPEVYLPPYHYANPGSSPEPRADLGMSAADLSSLATKISLLNDEIEVQNLQRAYGYYVDKNMWDEVTELFADDATLEIGGRGVFVGKKRINQYMHFLGKQGPQKGWLFDHSQWQPIVHVAEDGRTAKQRLRAFVMGGTQGSGEAVPAFAVWGECTYENEYVKVDGAWKIAKLYAYFNMYAPTEGGWAKTGMPNTKPEKNLPPDRPPTVVYQTYPTAGMVPYHYANPVTGK